MRKKILRRAEKKLMMQGMGWDTPTERHSETSFKKITGLLPLEYRSKYNKEAAVGE